MENLQDFKINETLVLFMFIIMWDAYKILENVKEKKNTWKT
jgi:hypothetical protein